MANVNTGEDVDTGDALPAGGPAGSLPPSDSVSGSGAGLEGPVADEALGADAPVAPAEAAVTALLQQVLASNQAIVDSNHAIAARITAIEIAQRQLHPPRLQHLPTAAQPADPAQGRASCHRGPPGPSGPSHLLGSPNPVRRPPPAWSSRPSLGWRPGCGGPCLAPNISWRAGVSAPWRSCRLTCCASSSRISLVSPWSARNNFRAFRNSSSIFFSSGPRRRDPPRPAGRGVLSHDHCRLQGRA